MLSHSLSEWTLEDDPYLLVGIHSSLEPYRMAYMVNKYLNARFYRSRLDQDVTLKASVSHYPVYRYDHNALNTTMYLLPNKVWGKYKSMDSSTGLFSGEASDTIKTTLIKEFKKVDYLLKIERDESLYPLKQTLQRINEIPHVVSCYQLNQYKIKQQDYLIFD